MAQYGYHVVIKQVTRELVKKNEYVGKDDERANDAGYRNWKETEDVERTIYTQIVTDLDLKDVIDAVNAKVTQEGN